MSIKRFFLLLFIATTLFCTVGHAQLSILPLTNATKRTIVVLGSSSAYGWRSTVPDSAWVARLQKDLHFYGRGDTIINLATPGFTTYDVLPTGTTNPPYADPPQTSNNITAALTYNPTFVIISLPTNDIADGYTNTETLANYTTITNKLIAAHIPFILTGTQPRDLATDPGGLSGGNLTPAEQADLNTFNGLLSSQYPSNSTPYNTPVVNNFLTLLSVSATNFEINPTISYGDGIHYVDNGHRIVYDTMVNFQYYKDLVCFTQTITLSNPISSTVGSSDFAPGSASSGLALTYTSSSNNAVATIVNNKIHIVGAGSTLITVKQAGNQHYLAAPTVVVTLNVTASGPAPTTYDWTGATSTNWQVAGNWKVGGVTATDWPGHSLSTDIANVGVNISYTNNPVISAAMPNAIASLTFGDNLITGSGTTSNSLTVNSGVTLNITGQLLQKHTAAGVLNSGNTAVVNAITTYISGAGTINCGSLDIGDNTTPTANGVVNITKLELGSLTAGSTVTMNVTGNFILNTQSSDNGGGTLILSTNDAQFSLAAGTLTIGGQIQLTDGGATNYTGLFKPVSKFSIDLYNNSDSPVLNLTNANAITNQTGNTANVVDFYNIITAGGAGIATVNYNGTTSQEVYNFVSGSTTASGIIDSNGSSPGDGVVYENLGFDGSGTKTVDASSTLGTLQVAQTVVTPIFGSTATVDFSANNCALLVGSDFKPGFNTTFNFGTRNVVIGGSFYNYGACNFNTAMVYFSSTGTNFMFTAYPQLLTNVTVNGDGDEYMGGNQFMIASTGVLNIVGAMTQLHAGGYLTLNSDSTGSATIAAIPTGCAITDPVTVQRYVTKHRAYRLASSPVYVEAVGTNNVYSLNYLKNYIWLTGTTGNSGGFDKSGNPTLYLYRENLAPTYNSFLTSNFRGVNNITDTVNYQLDVDGAGPFNLPAGNGYMFYYRGSKNQGSLAALTTAGALPTNDTLSTTGLLNQGTITVSNWYTPSSTYLLYTNASSNVIIEGTNLVGNPYASSIDWDQYSTTNSAAGIYAPNVAPFAYQLIPTGAQGSGNYGVYQANTGDAGTNNSTNIIGSGVGFFVQATNASAQLIFNENAKTNTQAVVGSSLFMATHVTHASANTTATNNQSIRFQLAKDSINADESIIRFDKKATALFDPMQDAKYKLGTGVVSLSSLSSDKIALAINRVPLPKNNQTLAIPLKLGANADGSYQLKLKTINQVPQLYDIWLIDKFLKDSTDMRKTATYGFAITKADTNTYGSGRFLVAIRENPAYAYKLLSFGAGKVPRQMQVSVSWTTQYEGNYTNFTVERSNDNGNTFNAVGGFTSTGTGTYNLIDKTPSYGDNQYRLKQVDVDNNVTYSAIADVQIANKDNRTVCIYPNPASSVINLCIDTKSANANNFNIRISNSSGVLVKDVLSSTANWQDNVSNLLTGTYLVQVINKKNNSLVGEAKFVKL